MKDSNTKKQIQNKNNDLQDSADDEKQLENNAAQIDLPEVKDIPGQEFVQVPNMDEFSDSTISSSDEEGELILDNESNEVLTNEDSNVTPLEKQMLDASANDMPTRDELQLRRAGLDDRDDDGDPLNEKTSVSAISGSDLDVPGSEDDDQAEATGEEDEENNPYSLGGDDQSVNEERNGT